MDRVLIIDDEKSIRLTISAFLGAKGYVVDTAEDGTQAQAFLDQNEYDVVICDVLLPCTSGLDLLKMIRTHFPVTQVIMITGQPSADSAAEIIRLGAFDYLIKPFSKGKVLHSIANAANKAHNQRRLAILEKENQEYRINLEKLIEHRTAELKRSEKLLRTVIDATPAGIFVKDEEGRYTLVNKQMADSHHTTTEEMVGQLDRKYGRAWLNDKKKLTEFRASEERVLRTGEPLFISEESFTYPDGSIGWFQTSKVPLDLGDSKRYLLGVSVDLTRRKKAEEELAESEIRYASVVENSLDAIIIHREGIIQYINPVAEAIFQVHLDDIVGGNIIQFIAPESRELVVKNLQARYAGKDVPNIYEITILKKDGTTLPVELNTTLFEFEGNTSTLAFIRDITTRKEAEKELRENEIRFRALANATFEGIAFSEKGIVMDANMQMCQILGYELDDLIGMSVTDVVHPDDIEVVANHIKSGSEAPYQHRSIRKDGSVIDVEARPRMMEIDGKEFRVTEIRNITSTIED